MTLIYDVLTSYSSLNIVKISTIAKVPIMDVGDFGEKKKQVRIDIIKKYTFAALLNWNSSDKGAHERKVYLVVLTELDFLCYSLFFS